MKQKNEKKSANKEHNREGKQSNQDRGGAASQMSTGQLQRENQIKKGEMANRKGQNQNEGSRSPEGNFQLQDSKPRNQGKKSENPAVQRRQRKLTRRDGKKNNKKR